jgi:hypothetical protein
MELMAELRPSGRVLDAFRISVGGTRLLNVEASLYDLLPLDTFKADFRPKTSSSDGISPRRRGWTGRPW